MLPRAKQGWTQHLKISLFSEIKTFPAFKTNSYESQHKQQSYCHQTLPTEYRYFICSWKYVDLQLFSLYFGRENCHL